MTTECHLAGEMGIVRPLMLELEEEACHGLARTR